MSTGRTLPGVSSCDVALRDGYEELRRQAVGHIPGGDGCGRGLALFLSRGMVAWMRALLPLVPATATPTTAARPAPADVQSVAREELTGLLVSMVLAQEGG